MRTSITDAEFIELWQRNQSAAAVAKILKIDVRNVHKRRKRIERKHGLMLKAADKRSPTFNVTIPQNGVRVNVEIDDGIIIVGSDAHYQPDIATTAHRAFVIAVRELKPKIVVMNGDLFDGASISSHPRIQWQQQLTVKQELDAVQERLSEIEAVAGNAKLHWTWGNHDMRFCTRLANMVPQYEGVPGFDLTQHFPRWRFSMSVMVNDHTMIKHRSTSSGLHAVYQNTVRSGASMITGHLHSLKCVPHTNYLGTSYGVDCGCLADVHGEQFSYGEDNPKNHRAGFAVLTFRRGVLMPPELLEVIDEDEGLVFFRGQLTSV